MVFFARFIGAAVALSSLVSALPRPQDSAIGDEVAVSAPNGTPITDSAELASQTSAEAAAKTADSNLGNAASMNNQWTSSVDAVATSTTVAWSSYQTPSYGSGSSNWGGSDYNDCVSQCIATYGSPANTYTPSPTTIESSGGSGGNGVTHTVIVAPSQGVLRYVPFAVNASIGDTIKFMWGANNHTVTKSSALTPCNKSSDALFASGQQNKDFVFTQVVNDTNPTFFHCAVPGHCQKGMFGIINPSSAIGAPTSVSGMMSSIASSNADISAYQAYTTTLTANNDKAARWGGNIDMASLPDWSHSLVAENVLYTRSFLASNPEVMKDDGSIDLSGANATPLMIPEDIGAALNNAGSSSSSLTSPSSPVGSSSSANAESSAPAQTQGAENSTNGAASLTTSRALVALSVFIATFFAL